MIIDPKKKEIARKKRRHYQALRRAYKKAPVWANLEEIKQFYVDCPAGCEVDHIIPFSANKSRYKEENATGLHVIENLQYLTSHENSVKSNKYNM